MIIPPLGRLVLVLGKGGVGKTTVATALARATAARGGPCALVAFGDAGEATARSSDGVERITLDAEAALATAAVPLFRSAVVSRLVLANFAISRLARAAPVLRELALLECVRQIAKARPGAVVVVDMPATGHGVAWLRAPRQVLSLLPPGPARRFVEAVELEMNGAQASSVVVTLPEPLPLRESVELCQALRDTVGRSPAWLVVNRVPRQLSRHALPAAEELYLRSDPASRPPAAAAVRAIAARSRAWARAEAEIEHALARQPVPWSTIPEIAGDGVAETIAGSMMLERAA